MRINRSACLPVDLQASPRICGWTFSSGAPPLDSAGRKTDSAAVTGRPARPHVLVVDDENLIADSVAAILNRNGFDAVARYTGVSAIEYLDERRPDILVSDVMLPDLDGVRLGISVRALCPDTRIVLFSGHASTAAMLETALLEGHSFELLSKPIHPAQLLKALGAS